MFDDQTNAIRAALANDWKTAIKVNRQIIKQNPSDISAMNRMAYAYEHAGQYGKACKIYKQVLEIDRYNLIAKRNLVVYQKQKDKEAKRTTRKKRLAILPTVFLNESGKTKTLDLVSVAQQSVLITLQIGQTVALRVKRHCIEVRDSLGTYLGALPDDTSYHLSRQFNRGSHFQAYIKSISKNSVSIFVKELPVS